MNRVGILVGREKTFPEALIKTINERGNARLLPSSSRWRYRYDDPQI